MGIHENTHPEFQADCFVCRASTVSVAPSATPSRKGGARAADINATEKRWHRDMDAYASMRAQGIQPRQIDGSDELSARAADKMEVEAGHVLKSKAERDLARDAIAEMKQS